MAKSAGKRQSIRTIGIVAPGRMEHALSLIAGVARHNSTWMVTNIKGPAASLGHRHLSMLKGSGVNGLVCDASALSIAHPNLGEKPVVWVFGDPDTAPTPQVLVDDEAVGRMAAEHLLEQGFRVFGYLGRTAHAFSARRLAGFRKGLSLAQCECVELEGAFNSGQRWTQSPSFDRQMLVGLLARLPRPVGVLAATDELAVRLVHALQEMGFAIPGDVAVMGSENLATYCEFTPPTITSIDLNVTTMGSRAGELMDRLLSGESVKGERIVVQPAGVIVRQSTQYEPAEDSAMSVALRYLRATPPEMLDLSEMYALTPASRRTLERRFQDRLGRTPAEEVRRLHMSHARQLLRTTDLTLSEIAVRCGYEHASHFCRAFKRENDMTPTEYRQRQRS